MSALVQTEKITKRYVDGRIRRTVIDAVDVSISVGEVCALVGPSGSGKTTLLGLLGAMITPTSGDVRLEGESIVHLRDHHRAELRKRTVGFVFQELALLPDLDVLDNVLLPLVPEGGASRPDLAKARERLARLGLDEREHTLARHLSGGERQRAAIARALVREPKLLLLDEPTAHLDAAAVIEVTNVLRDLRAEGRTIVCATHDPRLIESTVIDRVLRLSEGQLRSSALVDSSNHERLT